MGKELKIKKRIKSVKSINQITKAMEMTAASKLRRAQDATLRARTYAISARKALGRLRLLTEQKDHPLFQERKGNRRLIVLFSSDRGLAGAYNSNIFKAFLNLDMKNLKLIVVGHKGAQFANKLGQNVETIGVYTHLPSQPTPEDMRPIVTSVMHQFIDNKVDRVTLLYTNFISTINQEVTLRNILPIDPSEIPEAKQDFGATTEATFEPSPQQLLEYIIPRLVEVQIYQASLESTASEHSMRMIAMKNASDNAKDLTDELTLAFNGARQAAITQELAEITAGAEVIS